MASTTSEIEERNEKKETEELNDENIWQESMKVRKKYFCAKSPTLVFVRVNGRELTSQTSLLKFIAAIDKSIAKKVKAHTFSQSWSTMFVHFKEDVQELNQFAEKFNEPSKNNKRRSENRS